MKLLLDYPDDMSAADQLHAIRRAERFCLFIAGAGAISLLCIVIRLFQGVAHHAP